MPIRPPNTGNVRSTALGAAPTTHTHVEADVTDLDHLTTEEAQDAIGTILTDSAEIDFTYDDATPQITASIVASSIDETKLDASVNASLDLADSSVQPGDDAADLGSGAAADNTLLTADGVGGAAWEAASAHGGHVTNGDTHDHSGGDGAQVDHGGLAGLADDDHTQYHNDTRHKNVHSFIRAERITSDQAYTTNTLTTVIFNSVITDEDPDNDISVNTSTGVVTFNTTGLYIVMTNVSSRDLGQTFTRNFVRLNLNSGTIIMQADRVTRNANVTADASTLYRFTATDTLAVEILTTGTTDPDIVAQETTHIVIQRVW